jgi:uncharacterized membrane protein
MTVQSSRALALALFIVIALAAVAAFVVTFPQLPDQVTTRFVTTEDGQADEGTSKVLFAAMYLGVTGLMAAYALASRYRVHKLPERWFKIVPNHAHWLDPDVPERREAALTFVSALLTWIATLTLGIFAASFGLIIWGNLDPAPRPLDAYLGIMNTIYLMLLFAMAVAFRRRFTRPREKASEG